ncbi:SMI1/KNR4 family protein [Peribacillus simplex]|uniref:SMI1/KNR4 family protein n=1 Tax=Peribacillus simplex TaxID=1478 RepID=UPI0036711533
MKYSALQEFIKQYGEDDDFTGGVSEDKLKETEQKLQVPLPESYKWFLKNYGSDGSLCYNNIFTKILFFYKNL